MAFSPRSTGSNSIRGRRGAGPPSRGWLARRDDIASQRSVRSRPGSRSAPERLTVTTAHRTIAVADINGFGQRWRTNANQVRLRSGMYSAMQHAFDGAGIGWSSCFREDRGDGVLVLAQAEVPKTLFVDRLPAALADALTEHNGTHPWEERIHLRLALHAGEVNFDDHGVTSAAINHAFRLVEAEAFKCALAESSAVLAIVGSAWFFDEVIRHSEQSHATSYRPAEIVNKETSTQGWIRLLGRQVRRDHRLVRPV
jgi:hypothetical protein